MCCLLCYEQSRHSACVENSDERCAAETPSATGNAAGEFKDLGQTLQRNPADAPNYAYGNYVVTASGGGVDSHLNQMGYANSGNAINTQMSS